MAGPVDVSQVTDVQPVGVIADAGSSPDWAPEVHTHKLLDAGTPLPLLNGFGVALDFAPYIHRAGDWVVLNGILDASAITDVTPFVIPPEFRPDKTVVLPVPCFQNPIENLVFPVSAIIQDTEYPNFVLFAVTTAMNRVYMNAVTWRGK